MTNNNCLKDLPILTINTMTSFHNYSKLVIISPLVKKMQLTFLMFILKAHKCHLLGLLSHQENYVRSDLTSVISKLNNIKS